LGQRFIAAVFIMREMVRRKLTLPA